MFLSINHYFGIFILQFRNTHTHTHSHLNAIVQVTITVAAAVTVAYLLILHRKIYSHGI